MSDLGLRDYADAFALQQRAHAEVLEGRAADGPMRLLLVEHPPVVTVSRRPGAASHLVASPERLASLGIQVAETDRGGDITYHGPGQLVAYPIVDLQRLELRVHAYVRALEEAVIQALAGWGVEGRRDPEATGVWVGGGAGRKICAIGVRVGRWVTTHGLALNVTTDLRHFQTIVPCGLHGRDVTSLERERSFAAAASSPEAAKPALPPMPAMSEVKAVLAASLAASLRAVSLPDPGWP